MGKVEIREYFLTEHSSEVEIIIIQFYMFIFVLFKILLKNISFHISPVFQKYAFILITTTQFQEKIVFVELSFCKLKLIDD